MSLPNLPSPRPKHEWRDAKLAERAKWLDEMFLGHPQAAAVLRHVDVCLDHLERNQRSHAMAVIGGTGAGKTTLAKRLLQSVAARYPDQQEDRTIKAVLQLKIPAICNPFEFSVSLLKELGEHQPRARRDKAATIEASSKFLNECKVRLVVVDNLQDVPERRGKRGIEIIAAHLRNLIDSSNALWIFLGTHAAIDVLHSNDQFLRRVSHRAYLDYFRVDSPHAQKNFLALMQQLDRWLPLAESSCITRPQVAALLFIATEGIFDRIVRLLDQAWQDAVKDGGEAMDVHHLTSAYKFVNGDLANSSNPFLADFAPRLLNRVGEPFEVLHGGANHARHQA